MNFNLLSLELLENSNLKEIIKKKHLMANPIAEKKYIPIESDLYLYLLQNNLLGTTNLQYYPLLDKYHKETKTIGTWVFPSVIYDEILEKSKIVEEQEDTITVEFGRFPTKTIDDENLLINIENRQKNGILIKTDRKITIALEENGKKHQLSVYKDKLTGYEYVIMSENNQEETINIDKIRQNSMSVMMIKPLKWIVDKQSKIAIPERPLFISQGFDDYSKSNVKRFLNSSEFLEELDVEHKELKEEKEQTIQTPFGKKKDKEPTIADKIKRIIKGKHRIPYLIGHPGVGKTQIARSINPNYIHMNISTFTPDAFTGKTIIAEETTKLTKPEWYINLEKMSKKTAEKNERCVLFLDEFDKLTPNMQVFINGVVDEPRTIAGWIIPENVDIILAGNTEEYSDAAFKISSEVASRLTTIELNPSVVDWLSWANEHKIDQIIRAYLNNYPNKIIEDAYDKDNNYDPSKSLTPRSWDQKINEEIKISRELNDYPELNDYMTSDNRKHFEEFIDNYFRLRIEEIVKGNYDNIDIYNINEADKHMIVNSLIAIVKTEEELRNAIEFISMFNRREYNALFEKVWLRINRKEEDIINLRIVKEDIERGNKHVR